MVAPAAPVWPASRYGRRQGTAAVLRVIRMSVISSGMPMPRPVLDLGHGRP